MKTIKVSAIIIMMVLLMAAICSMDGAVVQAKSKSVKVGTGMYTITNKKNREVRYDRPAKKDKVLVVIPKTVKIGKSTYYVTSIKSRAITNSYSKLKTLIIERNVKKIGKKAICCKSLTSIRIQTIKLTKKSVGAKAFAKLNSKVTIIVPKAKLKAYRKLLKARGVTGKNQTIRTYIVTKPSNDDSDLEVKYAIGESKGGTSEPWSNTTDIATEYGAGENITFSMSIKMPQKMYGTWSSKKKAVTKYVMCNTCRIYFEYGTSDKSYYLYHKGQTGHGWHTIYSNPNKPKVELWYWTPNTTSCKIVYHATLPDGISYNENSVELYGMQKRLNLMYLVDSSNYTVSVNGNNILVTINDLKQSPYYGGGEIFTFIMSFRAKVTENAANVNQINADITYNRGSGDRVINLGSTTVLTSTLKFDNTDTNGNALDGTGYTLYKITQPKYGSSGYSQVGEEITGGSSFTINAIGTGQYKLVQTTAPVGYKRMDDYEFCITGDEAANGFTSLKVTDLNGNSLLAPGGTAWAADAGTHTVSTRMIHEIDESQTKEIMATVKYDLNGEIQSDATETIKGTVQVLENNGKISTAAVTEKSFSGYKVGSITVNGKTVDTIPETVSEGDVIIYHYVIDEDQKHTVSVYVQYFKDGMSQSQDNWIAEQEVPMASSTIDLTASFNRDFEKNYEGYKLEKIVIVDTDKKETEITVLPNAIEAGSYIRYYYVTDNSSMETLTMTVKYSLDGEIQEDDTFVYSEEVAVAESDGNLKNVVLPEKSYTGYKFYRYEYESGSPIGQSLTRVSSGSTVIAYCTKSLPRRLAHFHQIFTLFLK